MTRYSYGIGGVLEEDIPGTIELRAMYTMGTVADSTKSNVDIGSASDSRTICVAFIYKKSGIHATLVSLDGFNLTKIAAKELTVSGGNYVSEYWYIDAGIGSLLEGETDADLRIVLSGSPSPVAANAHILKIEHAPNPRFIGFSSGTSNNRGITLPAKKNNVAAANLISASVATFSWSGLTKVADYFTAGSYFLTTAKDAIAGDGDITALCNISSSVGNAESAILFDKLDNPTYEKTDDDTQTSVTGDTMTSAGLDIGSGDDRTVIIAQAFMGQNIAFASMKCNGVSMHLADKSNGTVNSKPASACQFYLRRDELPDPSATTADFEIKIASGNCNAVLVVGCIRGGQGVLNVHTAAAGGNSGSPLYPAITPPGGPHVSVFGNAVVKNTGSATIGYLSGSVTAESPTNVFTQTSGNPGDVFAVVTAARELGLPFNDNIEPHIPIISNQAIQQGSAFAGASYI